jgi:ankyrin repeat protein/tetratricopeptide (TPR) repeat protein
MALPGVGARVAVQHLGGALGTVRFVGGVHYAKGEWAGVELDEPLGKNDGSVKGVRYFDAADKRGLFAKAADLSLATSAPAPAPGAPAPSGAPAPPSSSSSSSVASSTRSAAAAAASAQAAQASASSSSSSSSSSAAPAMTMPSGLGADELKQRGNELFAAKQFSDAAAFYSCALELDPDNHVLCGNRAACMLELGRGAEALADADRAVALRGDWWKAHARRGKALMLLEADLDSAAQSLATAATLVTDVADRDELLRSKQQCVRMAKAKAAAMQDQEQPAPQRGKGKVAGKGSRSGLGSGLGRGSEPAWMKDLPEDIQEEARRDPGLMAMLEEEMRKHLPGGDDYGSDGSDGAFPGMHDALQSGSEDDELSGGMPPGMIPGLIPGMPGGADAGAGGGIERQRLKKPVLVVLPLHEAVKSGSVDKVRATLAEEREAANFSVDEVDDHGRSALAWACQQGDLETIKVLLEEGGAAVDGGSGQQQEHEQQQQERGRASDDPADSEGDDRAIPLIYAVRSGKPAAVDLLLAHGATAAVREPILGHTIVHQAVKQGDCAMVAHLLCACGGALAGVEDLRGISALGLACKVKLTGGEEARHALVRAMVAGGATVEAGALYAALTHNDPVAGAALEKLLLDLAPGTTLEARPPLRTAHGRTVLHLAARARPPVEAEKALKRVLPLMRDCVDLADSDGLTPLGAACRAAGKAPLKVIKLLAAAGANVNAPQGACGSALHMVGEASDEPAWAQLVELGANQGLLDAKGATPKLKPDIAGKCVVS